MNAFNFMDGVDGMSGFVSIVVGLDLALVGALDDRAPLVVAGLVLAGAAAGFLPPQPPPGDGVPRRRRLVLHGRLDRDRGGDRHRARHPARGGPRRHRARTWPTPPRRWSDGSPGEPTGATPTTSTPTNGSSSRAGRTASSPTTVAGVSALCGALGLVSLAASPGAGCSPALAGGGRRRGLRPGAELARRPVRAVPHRSASAWRELHRRDRRPAPSTRSLACASPRHVVVVLGERVASSGRASGRRPAAARRRPRGPTGPFAPPSATRSRTRRPTGRRPPVRSDRRRRSHPRCAAGTVPWPDRTRTPCAVGAGRLHEPHLVLPIVAHHGQIDSTVVVAVDDRRHVTGAAELTSDGRAVRRVADPPVPSRCTATSVIPSPS